MLQKHILAAYRICNKIYYRKNKKFIDKYLLYIIYKYYSFLLGFFYGAYLPYKAKIGANLKLNHSFYGVFISESCSIGNNCTLLQHVTIGSNQPINNLAPIIGDNVFIGVNCSIIGDVSIGDNCLIGAGTVIAKGKIPCNSVVVGAGYRVISTDKH